MLIFQPVQPVRHEKKGLSQYRHGYQNYRHEIWFKAATYKNCLKLLSDTRKMACAGTGTNLKTTNTEFGLRVLPTKNYLKTSKIPARALILEKNP